MAKYNKVSLKEEAERIKVEFDKMAENGKLDSESKMLFKSMLMLINLLISIFLEKSTKKNNKNSSIPSSQTGKDESGLTDKGAKGKGKAETEATASNTRTVESTTTIEADYCPICGYDLSKTSCSHRERRTKIDIIFEKTVEHFYAEIKECPRCAATVKAAFPEDLAGPLQYGIGLKAYIINLLFGQMIAMNRVQKMVQTLIGEVIAESSFVNFIMALYTALALWEAKSKLLIRQSPAIHADETSCRVDKKNHWIHVYAAGDITLKFLHRRRGIEAIEKINIIPLYKGALIHDCWSPYLSYESCEHALCGSHLTRELTHAIEANAYRWAKKMKSLLLETCKTVSAKKGKALTLLEYARLQKKYRTIITQAEKELPEIPPKADGKRGKIAKSDAHNLWERLKKHETAILLFAIRPEVSFTNNRAERDLRMSKVKQKVSGCFRSEKMAKAYCRISSYLQTMATKGYNPLIAIEMALKGVFVE